MFFSKEQNEMQIAFVIC